MLLIFFQSPSVIYWKRQSGLGKTLKYGAEVVFYESIDDQQSLNDASSSEIISMCARVAFLTQVQSATCNIGFCYLCGANRTRFAIPTKDIVAVVSSSLFIRFGVVYIFRRGRDASALVCSIHDGMDGAGKSSAFKIAEFVW